VLVLLCFEAIGSPSKRLAVDLGESASSSGELSLDISIRLPSSGDRPCFLSEALLSEELSRKSRFFRALGFVPVLDRGDCERGFLTKGDTVTLSRSKSITAA
jgi:hypothetical protein